MKWFKGRYTWAYAKGGVIHPVQWQGHSAPYVVIDEANQLHMGHDSPCGTDPANGTCAAPAAPAAPATARCSSCEHDMEFHRSDGCWHAVQIGRHDRAMGCPCGVSMDRECPECADMKARMQIMEERLIEREERLGELDGFYVNGDDGYRMLYHAPDPGDDVGHLVCFIEAGDALSKLTLAAARHTCPEEEDDDV